MLRNVPRYISGKPAALILHLHKYAEVAFAEKLAAAIRSVHSSSILHACIALLPAMLPATLSALLSKPGAHQLSKWSHKLAADSNLAAICHETKKMLTKYDT